MCGEGLNNPEEKSFRKLSMGKRENAGNKSPYSPTILDNMLSLYLGAFESNTISDPLNQSQVVLLTNSQWKKDEECPLEYTHSW